MTDQHDTVLSCFEDNLRNARTEGARKFVRKQIADYLSRKPRNTVKQGGPDWDREIPNELIP